MRSTTGVIAALVTAVVLGVGGCAAPVVKTTHTPGSQDCRGNGNCKIDIQVDTCNPSSPNPATCNVYAVQDVTLIDKHNAKLTFDILTQGFSFDPKYGIAFTPLNNGNQYFTCAPQGPNYECRVNVPVGNAGPFKYTILIVNLNVADPWIVNY